MARAKTQKVQAHQIGAPYIEQMLGADKGKIFDLSMDIMSIGRAPDNDIIFPSESVSRCHAFLKRTEKGWLLQDNQSKNGVKRNGEKVSEAHLRDGDVIQVGDFVFKFVESGSSPNTGSGAKESTATGRLSAKYSQVAANIAPRPAPTIVPAPPPPNPIVDEAYRSLRANGVSWSTIQFGGGIAALVVISVLIGFKLRNVFGHHEEPKKVAAISEQMPQLPPLNVGPAEKATAAPVVGKPAAKANPQEPIDQNNPNEGRIVADEPVDLNAPGNKLLEAATAQGNAAPAGQSLTDPATANQPPPPPLSLNDGLSKKDLQIQAKKASGRNVTKDLGVYLQEGRDYLKEGDFESAALAFRFALVIDPTNRTAIEGIRAAEYRRKELPPSEPGTAAPNGASASTTAAEAKARASLAPNGNAYVDNIPLPPGDRKTQVRTLLKNAQIALAKRSYQDAINNAERARRIEIRGETAYLNEAKQIIDRAKLKQKEDFDPFLARAKEKLKAGDYAGSKMLCEEMLRTDPAYHDARECVSLANEGLQRGKK